MNAKQQWDRLKAERDALPRGHPRRTMLSNQMNKLNVADGPLDPREGLRSGAANAAGIPEPEKVYSGRGGEDALAQIEEEQWRTNEALRQAQLQQAVTAPDAPGAEFIDQRVDALQDQLSGLGVPPESQGVGTDLREPAPGERPNIGVPQGLEVPGEVGGVPGIDSAPPDVAQQTIDEEVPDAADPRKEGTAKQKPQSMARKDPGQAMATAEQVVNEQGEEPSAELMNKPKQEVIKQAEQLAEKNPGMVQQAENTLKQAFGDLFDSKELMRMGVLFLGALATGASPGQALAYAGQNYLARVDAAASNKAKYQHDLIKSGKYTPASIEAYLESNDPSQLIPTEQLGTMEELGNQEEFFDSKGNRITAREVKVGDNKYWVDGQGRPVNLNNVHTDPSRAPGTPEYTKRIQTEAKTYTKAFEEMQERFGTFGEGAEKQYATELLPGKVGLNAAKWANKNGVPADAMGSLLDNAYQSAIAEAKMTGKKPRSIEAYLNEQYIKSEVGDPALFMDKDGNPAEATKVNELMNIFQNQLSNHPAYQGLSKTAISTRVIQAGRAEWNNLDPDIKLMYERRAGPGQSPFMVYLLNEASKP